MTHSETSRLAHFPVTFFATTMGFGGLTLALHAAGDALPMGSVLTNVVLAITIAVFGILMVTYVAKVLRHRAAVQQEWHHPVKLAFFPTVSISLLLISVAVLDMAPGAAKIIWIIATTLHFALTLLVVSGWINRDHFEPGHLTPAWFIPAVGNVIIPIAGAPLGFVELSWFFFSIGIVFWLVLLTLVFNRLVFHAPLPARLFPTLVILVAPPSVAFVAWLKLTGEVGTTGRILINSGYFFALLVALQIPRLMRLPFALSFWALSFPLAALTVASFAFARETGSGLHMTIGFVLLTTLGGLVIGLILRTLRAMAQNQICVPE